jgi:DNA invertase Pin-like site-specific DNA recombinase
LRQRIACNRCLAALRPGDTLKFTKIDRTGRSLAHLVDVTMVLSERGVNVVALDTGVISTTTAGRSRPSRGGDSPRRPLGSR